MPTSPLECFNPESNYGSLHRLPRLSRESDLRCISRHPLIPTACRNNIYCSVAIIGRLWSRHSAIVEAGQNSQIWRTLRIFVESASLLT